MKALSVITALLLLVPTLLQAAPLSQKLWTEILGEPAGQIPAVPAPGGKISWRTDFAAALKEAQAANRPLLVTWRCLPCKQCAEFDKNVLEGSEALDPLLQRFVPVRLTDAAQLDERFFPYKTHQDLDLSWWGYFLSPQEISRASSAGKITSPMRPGSARPRS